MRQATVSTLSVEDYLAGEAESPIRHEYVAGYAYAMSGASKAHNNIVLNIGSRLRQFVRGKPCRGFVSDMRVRVELANAYYYPDVVVTCSDYDTAPHSPRNWLTEPCLIVEVLSSTTEHIDRREKMRHYALLDSLQEYVLVDSRKQQVEVYRKLAEGGWGQRVWTEGETARFDSVGLEMVLSEIYEDVVFSQS